MRGDLDGGERACREALRCNPNYADAHSNLGAVLHKAGEGADSGAADGGWSQEELPASAAAVLIGDPVTAAAATAAASGATPCDIAEYVVDNAEYQASDGCGGEAALAALALVLRGQPSILRGGAAHLGAAFTREALLATHSNFSV